MMSWGGRSDKAGAGADGGCGMAFELLLLLYETFPCIGWAPYCDESGASLPAQYVLACCAEPPAGGALEVGRPLAYPLA